MICASCTTPGRYFLGCLACCARLVLSARPSRTHAAGMREAIRRFIERERVGFSIDDVMHQVRQQHEGGIHGAARA